MAKKYWLMKSEPSSYSIDDLKRDGKTCWDGVRNYQARNYMRDEMKKDDLVLFYHSSTEPIGIVGIARVCKEAYPDNTAWDEKHHHFDPRSTRDNPVWMMVDIEFQEKFSEVVTLATLKETQGLDRLLVIRPGQRLSIQPVKAEHFNIIVELGKKC